ncbi:hypothetical protein [Microbulbifer elongatus]|uniref:hypothetical protein n=1 Tax=Microbulbifer elongatus TaxID=86173 RepID=UPI001CFE3BE0|nr:hypothetical protein [Microbulbifer elongatus]
MGLGAEKSFNTLYPHNKVRQTDGLLCALFAQSLRSYFRAKNTQNKPPLRTALCIVKSREVFSSETDLFVCYWHKFFWMIALVLCGLKAIDFFYLGESFESFVPGMFFNGIIPSVAISLGLSSVVTGYKHGFVWASRNVFIKKDEDPVWFKIGYVFSFFPIFCGIMWLWFAIKYF